MHSDEESDFFLRCCWPRLGRLTREAIPKSA